MPSRGSRRDRLRLEGGLLRLHRGGRGRECDRGHGKRDESAKMRFGLGGRTSSGLVALSARRREALDRRTRTYGRPLYDRLVQSPPRSAAVRDRAGPGGAVAASVSNPRDDSGDSDQAEPLSGARRIRRRREARGGRERRGLPRGPAPDPAGRERPGHHRARRRWRARARCRSGARPELGRGRRDSGALRPAPEPPGPLSAWSSSRRRATPLSRWARSWPSGREP